MYNINDAVVYASYGVCVISAIEERDFSGENVEYYILHPVGDNKNTFYVPTSNSVLKNKMKSICSRQEIDRIISTMDGECCIWIENDFLRKEEYRKIIDKGDRHELVRLIKTLYTKSTELSQKRKKLRSTDEKFLRDAENMLYDEFAYSLNIPRDKVVDYIKQHI